MSLSIAGQTQSTRPALTLRLLRFPRSSRRPSKLGLLLERVNIDMRLLLTLRDTRTFLLRVVRLQSRRCPSLVHLYSHTYIHKVLKQVHPEVGISNKAMAVCNDLVEDVFQRLGQHRRAARESRLYDQADPGALFFSSRSVYAIHIQQEEDHLV